ncbi:MAG: ATP-dependent Clp protease adaptor ClpS [Dehalococcoidia bacterium]|nr:ATP-dependent Clp protease adaptor ClpS [Dehalococcoidia bacterium]
MSGTEIVVHERTDESVDLEPRWHVVLLNDDDHSYEYVIVMLGKIFGYGPEKSFALARLVDIQGQVVVATTTHERALDFQSKIHAFGADPLIPHCKGSMSALVEPAQ